MLDIVMPWVGFASFALSAAAWMMQRILWLRLTALCSGALGITYNGYLAMHADAVTASELWKIVGWLCLFFAILRQHSSLQPRCPLIQLANGDVV